MNIMDKLTLQEVKERFKNAKEVKCNEHWHYGVTYEIDLETIRYIHEKSTQVVCNSIKNDTHYVSLFHNGKYAEIISYKEPLYQLTAKEIVHAYENPQYLKDTFKECFETELEVNRWYKDDTLPNYLSFFTDNGLKYGFDLNGKWYHSKTNLKPSDDKRNRYATEKEVEEAFVKEAIKRGFKVGEFIKRPFGKTLYDSQISVNKYPRDSKFYYDIDSDYFEMYGFVIYSKGQWAEIITPTYTITEAESKFNIKIKAV